MDEIKLKEKLRLIEALFAGAKTAGEKDAADRARSFGGWSWRDF